MPADDFSSRSRGYLRTKVTNLHNKVVKKRETINDKDKIRHVTNLTDWKAKLTAFNDKIGPTVLSETPDAFDNELETCYEYDDKIQELLTLLSEPPRVSDAAVVPERSLKNKLKIKEIPMPTFADLPSETLEHFIDKFEQVINKFELTDYEKFMYLKGQLSGEPLTLIDGLTDEDESYDGAVDLLREAFSDVLEQKYKTISRLRDLDMSKDSDPIMYIREVRMIEKLFTKLNITVNQVIQYFVWSSLTTRMQTQFIHMSNDNNPDLQFIDSNFFKALKRCREID